jgi:hypothetical protein
MKRTVTRVVLIATLALSTLAVMQAPALARFRVMADATLQGHRACRDGVRLDVGALSPRPIGEPAPSPLPPTQDVVVQGRIGGSTTGQLVLNETVTLPLRPREITLIDGQRALIDYFKRFRLRWDTKPGVGRVISFRAAAVGSVEFINSVEPIKRRVMDCRLFG